MSKLNIREAEKILTEYLRDPESLIPRKQDYLNIADQIIREQKAPRRAMPGET